MIKTKSEINYSRYPRYDELTAILHHFAEKYPTLALLKSVGKSWKGREIWCMEVTDYNTGPSDVKPAIYMDANMHAGEVTGTSICIKTIDYLLSEYGNDESITDLLKKICVLHYSKN